MNKIRITDRIQSDWVNHSSRVGVEEGIPWLTMPCEFEGINSCPRANLLDKGLKQELIEQGDFKSDYEAVGQVYSLFNGEFFGPWADVAISRRVFAGDMGPEGVFGKGVCVLLEKGHIRDSELRQALALLKYQGEVIATVDKTGKVMDFFLGSPFGAMQLYSYLFDRERIDKCLGFILQENPLEASEGICFSVLVGGGDYLSVPNPKPLQVPVEFRQNVFMVGNCGVAVASGKTVKEASVRIKKNLHNLKEKNGEVVYRMDYSYSSGLTLGFPTYGALVRKNC
jgi:hypothetical protein